MLWWRPTATRITSQASPPIRVRAQETSSGVSNPRWWSNLGLKLTNATEPKLKRLGKTTPLQIAALASMHQVAQIVAKRAQYFDKEVGQELSFMGENNLANLSAVKNLMAWARTRMCLPGPNRVSKACCLESTLVAALKRESELFSTEALEGEDFFHDTMIKF